MTREELIRTLLQYPEDMKVILSGQSGEVKAVRPQRYITAVLNDVEVYSDIVLELGT